MPTDNRTYDRVHRHEFEILLILTRRAVDHLEKPPQWSRRGAVGRPPTRRPGRPEELDWRAMAKALVLMTAAHFDYRQMEAFLALNHAVCTGLGFPRAPSRTTLWRAQQRFPEAWLRALNEEVLRSFKKKSAALADALSQRTPLDLRNIGGASGGSFVG
jgi:hypothetical protein